MLIDSILFTIKDGVAIPSVLGVLIREVKQTKLGASKYQEDCDNMGTKLTAGTLKVRGGRARHRAIGASSSTFMGTNIRYPRQ